MRSALAFLCLLLVGASQPPRHERDPVQNQTAGEVANALERIASTLQNKAESAVSNPPCQYGEDDRESDLCAQWKAADAAASASKATWLFGALGCAIGLLTLAAAWRAATWAKVAATHAEASVRSSEKGLRQSDRQSRRELRAYLAVSAGNQEYGSLSGPPKINLQIVNSGQTPAYDVSIVASTGLHFEQPKPPRLKATDASRFILPPNVPFPHKQEWPAEIPFEPQIGDKIWVAGEIRYTDIFNQRWVHRFALKGLIGRQELSACPTGNRETRFKA